FRKANEENCSLQEKEIRHVQTEGLFQHLCDNHDLCWPEVCWIKQNSEMQLKEPTLKAYAPFERNQFKIMLETIFKLPVRQGIGTLTCTSQNEAFNRIKLVYTSKLIDYPVSYQTRHTLAILHNNEMIEEGRDKQQIRNLNQITKHNAERALELQSLREDLNFFDWDQELVSYGRKAQEQINSNIFHPSFASHITDFDETTKCLACHSFPKCTARGLCKLCRFYVDNGLKSQIVDKNYQSKIEVSEKIDLETMYESALNGIFGFSDFRDGQKDAILSFAQNHDTLVLKQTGGGKSLCYDLASVMTAGIIVVFSPLKALIDDQVLELINAGVPCCGLYASTAQPVHYQQKVFQEISCGLTKVIFTTPEKFKFNIGFQKMLERVGADNGIRFVVDEAHCILDQEHFRDSWSYLCNLKQNFPVAPILLLSATCKNIDAQEIVARLGNLMQESGRSARDGLPAKTIVMFNRKDIRTVMGIYSGRQERMADNPSFVNVKSNMQKMLEVIDAISKVKQQFGHLPVYQEKFPRILKTKEDAFLLLDDLVLRKLVEEDIVLTRSSAGQTCVCSVSILGLTEDAFAKANNQNWIYLIK
ncbi:289_t:CDS:2, partial [Entrophospora sp. SA101]